jgi:two-component system sensor histidine kinase TorS
MGASLSVHSVVGHGATFTLIAGFTPAHAADLPPDPRVTAVQPMARKLHVLVVEDNDINQLVIRTYLEDMGHAAKVVATAEAAFAALEDPVFDVILMDVNLPGLSGTAATRKIRAIPGGQIAVLPIIGISAHVQEAEILENLAAGMSAVLAKPLSPEALQTALRDHVPERHVLFTLVQDVGPDRAAALARLFLDGLPGGLAALEAAAKSADHVALSRTAHQLKGAAGNFDLGPLASRLQRIEALAPLGASPALDRCLQDLPEDLDRARVAVDAALGILDASLSQAAQ